MVSDEEILERAFLSALRKHFKKPGPWLPIQTCAAGEQWPSKDGITKGQVWEVYIKAATAITLNGMEWCSPWGTYAGWSPGFSTIQNDMLQGEIGTPGSGDTSLTYSIVYGWSPLSEGWLFGDGTILSSVGAFWIRARRRFDLET